MTPATTVQIKVNQTTLTLAAGATLTKALVLLQAKPPFAIAINRQFVPKARYDQTELRDGDQIELIAPVVGG